MYTLTDQRTSCDNDSKFCDKGLVKHKLLHNNCSLIEWDYILLAIRCRSNGRHRSVPQVCQCQTPTSDDAFTCQI